MYKFEEINTRYDFDRPIESKIVDFLNYYKIPKENIINIRNIGGNLATIIFLVFIIKSPKNTAQKEETEPLMNGKKS